MNRETVKEAADRGRTLAKALAAEQHFVVLRRQLAAHGVPRWLAQAEIRAGRWQRAGRQALVVHNGPLSLSTRQVIGVAEVGGAAALDGVSALQWWHVKGLDDTDVVVSTPRGSTPRHPRGVIVRETRRFHENDVVTMGVRVMPPTTAAIHAALWAVSDKQAMLFPTLVVQQGKATVEQLAQVLQRVRRHKRRRLLLRVLLELAGGAGSLGELDVAAGLRRRGLPQPTRQSVRKRPSGKEYLDFEFLEYDVVLEVDGAGHDEAWQRLSDTVRDIRHAAEGKTVVRLPLVAWRLDEEQVLDTLEELFAARGWQRPSAAA